MLLGSTLALALLMKEDLESANRPPSLEVAPSAFVLTGVGLHVHERPLPAWAVELTAGPKLVIDYPGPNSIGLRLAAGWGMDYNAARPLEHFGLLEVGAAAQLMRFFSVEYLVGAQVGVFEGGVEPAFRHAAAWRLWYVIGPQVQHIVAGPSSTSDGRPRQVVRILLSVDVAGWIWWAVA